MFHVNIKRRYKQFEFIIIDNYLRKKFTHFLTALLYGSDKLNALLFEENG